MLCCAACFVDLFGCVQLLQTLECHAAPVRCVSVSDDGSKIVSCSSDRRSVRVWSIEASAGQDVSDGVASIRVRTHVCSTACKRCAGCVRLVVGEDILHAWCRRLRLSADR